MLCSSGIGIIDGDQPPAAEFHGRRAGCDSFRPGGQQLSQHFNDEAHRASSTRSSSVTNGHAGVEVLRMATIEGARPSAWAMRLQVDRSRQEGRPHSHVDLSAPNLMPILAEPIRNIVPNLVYGANRARGGAGDGR